MSQGLLEQLDQDIANAEERVARLRQCREQILAIYGPPQAPAVKRRKPRVQAGSIPDRILELLREQQSMQLPAIVEGTKARKHDVKAALDELIAADRVQRVGKSRGTRYVLPGSEE